MTDSRYSTDADELRHLEDNIATVAYHLGQPGARLSVSHHGPAGLLVEPGEVLKEISRRLGAAQSPLRPYPELLDLRASLKAMLALFDDEGNMTATFVEMQNAINGGYESLTRNKPSYEMILDAAQAKRISGACGIVDEAACLIWDELCPGMVMGDSDLPHYEAAAKAVLGLTDPAYTSWRPIETAPHAKRVLLGWHDWHDHQWCVEVGPATTGQRFGNGYSNLSQHGSATHWQPIPEGPVVSSTDCQCPVGMHSIGCKNR